MKRALRHLLFHQTHSVAATPGWWEDPVFAGVTWQGIYHARGATSQAASYTNLANPGTHDLTQYDSGPVAWDGANGWWFTVDSAYQALNTGLTPPADHTWSFIVKFSDLVSSETNKVVFGANSGTNRVVAIRPYRGASDDSIFNNGPALNAGTRHTAGVLGIAGNKVYSEGVIETGTIGAWEGTSDYPIFIGGYNSLGTPTFTATCKVQAFVIASSVLTAPQMLAAYNALQAIPAYEFPYSDDYDFELINRSADFGTENCQGVAYDGTYHYFSDSRNILKCTRDSGTNVYTEVLSRDVHNDSPADDTQINGMNYYNGSLWVSANNFDIPESPPRKGWIMEYDLDDLTWIATHNTEAHWSEACAWKDIGNGPECWVVYHDWPYVSRYALPWTHVADYLLPIVEGQTSEPSAKGLYQGVAWYGDILITQTHAINPNTETHFHRWTGSGFVAVDTVPALAPNVGQGIHWEVEGEIMLFAERDTGGNGQCIVRATFVDNS